ncbi:MAG: peptidoglycan-binding protein [Candidatus Sericytochromatia bacterium]|nr:peptidoglycan-binding protein [Candidatus Sericytochromatia bacterium]
MAGVYDVTLVRNATGIEPETLDHYQRLGKVMFTQGERSAEIGWMQTQLSNLGFDTKGTGGAYGNGTREAIRAFQSANNLPVTGGNVDHHTLVAIENAFRSHQQSQPDQVMFQKGQTHAQLRPLQQALTGMGYNTGGTAGQFGPRTEAAVSAFQTAEGLPVSGKIDNQTWLRILERAAQPD